MNNKNNEGRKYVNIDIGDFIDICHLVIYNNLPDEDRERLREHLIEKLMRMKAHDEYQPKGTKNS